MKTNPTFAELVADAKDMRRWTRQDVAEGLGVSRHTLRSWLKAGGASGRQAPPWAVHGLRAMVTGEAVYEQRGEIEIVYRHAGRK